MTQRVFGITGWKNSGKTGLAARLVTEFTRRGYRVSTVKHAHHDFDIDKPGADSFRHREAGAHEVAIVSGTRFAIMHELRDAPEPALADILTRLAPCDLVLIEGYKREPIPKIEARRLEAKNREPAGARRSAYPRHRGGSSHCGYRPSGFRTGRHGRDCGFHRRDHGAFPAGVDELLGDRLGNRQFVVSSLPSSVASSSRTKA